MELSRDKVKEIINDDWLLMDDCEGNKNCDVVKELARIALASLEAEAVGTFRKGPCGYSPSFHEDAVPLYTAHPAPVSVPEPIKRNDADGWWMYKGRRVGGGCAEWYNRALDDCRAAMLQGADGAKSPSTIQPAPELDSSPKISESPTGINQGKSEPVTTANKLPFEQWLSQQTGTIDVECGCVMTEVFFHWLRVAYEAGNSPVIPDGWVMVPAEPTAEMLQSGISTHYERSQIQIHDRPAPGPMECAYVAMLAAAPQQEAKNV